MKLPKCPHCEKVLVGVLVNVSYVGNAAIELGPELVWYCPDKKTMQKPDWVEVLEV